MGFLLCLDDGLEARILLDRNYAKKRKYLMKKFAIVAATVFVTSFVIAQDAELTIDGGVEQTVTLNAGALINASVGEGTSASQSVEAVESGDITGNITQVVEMGEGGAVNAAVGDNSCADQSVASIGKKTSC